MAWQRVVDKYLERYAEPISHVALRAGPTIYDAAVVVPVFSEGTETLHQLISSVDSHERALFILVVNAPPTASPSNLEQNERLLEFVRGSGTCEEVGPNVQWVRAPLSVGGCDLVLIDVTSGPHRLKEKEGVGRARRIGLDFALALHRKGHLRSPFCGSSDADVFLPPGYFSALAEPRPPGLSDAPSVSGLLFPYRHQASDDPRTHAVMTELEISFRYYVLGLDYAGSPYAYHSLGSALAVSLPHYAGVRGVPNRQAGEDFHLLSKLSKLAPLERLRSPTIEIKSRLSDRVPFGTGPSLARALGQVDEGLRFYHPHAFELLRAVLRGLEEAASAEVHMQPPSSWGLPAWAEVRATQVWESVRPLLASCPDREHRLRRLHERFDALRTLQFIHEAHKNGLERVPLGEAFELARFLPGQLDLKSKLEHCVQMEESVTRPAGISPA